MGWLAKLEFLEDTHVGEDFFVKGEVYEHVIVHEHKKWNEIEITFGDGSIVTFPYIWKNTAFILKRMEAAAV
jgi:hypothetical protein